MKTDICECGDTRDEHDTRILILEGMVKPGEEKIGGKFGGLEFDGCIDFKLDRKATWNADRGRAPRRTCLLMTGCVTCGTNCAVTYHKDARGVLRHTGCPGPRPAEVAR